MLILLLLLLLVTPAWGSITTTGPTIVPPVHGGTGLDSSALTGYAKDTAGVWSFVPTIPFTDLSGSIACSQLPALTGNVTTSAGACATTIAAGVVTNAMLVNSTITLNAGSSTGLTAPGAMSLGATYTVGAITDEVRFTKLGLGVTPTYDVSIARSSTGITTGDFPGVRVLNTSIATASLAEVMAQATTAASVDVQTRMLSDGLGTNSMTGSAIAGAVGTRSTHPFILATANAPRVSISTAGVVTLVAYGTGLLHSSSGGVLTSSLLVNADITDGTIANVKLANSTITLNAGTGTGLTAPGAMSLGSTYTIGATSDQVTFDKVTVNHAAGNASFVLQDSAVEKWRIINRADASDTLEIASAAGATSVIFLRQAGGVEFPTYGTGLLHSSSAGVLTSSLLVNADITTGTIAAAKLIGTDIATLGTITAGTWHATVVDGLYGGTGVANSGKTITLGGNLTTSGAFATTLTVTAATGVTLPTTGTLATLAGSEALTNKTVNGLTITTSTGTLTVANGKTATVSNTLTLTGTDASSVAFGAGGTVAYTANDLSVFAATTSAQLRGVLSDETGTGVAVFGTSPTLTTGYTVSTGGTNTVKVGQNASATTYNAISLNGTLTDPAMIGLSGGGGTDGNLYFEVPTGGAFKFRVNAVAVGLSQTFTMCKTGACATTCTIITTDGITTGGTC